MIDHIPTGDDMFMSETEAAKPIDAPIVDRVDIWACLIGSGIISIHCVPLSSYPDDHL